MSEYIYLLDADVFIESWKTHQAPDVFASYWDWFKREAHSGKIRTVRPCYDDLCVVKDGLSEWVDENCPHDFVLPIDQSPAVLEKYRDLMEWAMGHPQYNDGAKLEFADVSDAWLVASAMATSPKAVVVTRETFDPKIKKRIKIPNVCADHGVTCLSFLEWLRASGAKI
jgi:hypothetical protein